MKYEEEICSILWEYAGKLNYSKTRKDIATEIANFMKTTNEESWGVICNEQNNPPENVEKGMLTVDVLDGNNDKYSFTISPEGVRYEKSKN